MVINFIDSIYTLILTYNLIRLYFSKKKEKKRKGNLFRNLEKEKTRNWQSLVSKRKKEAISREFRADIKKKKKKQEKQRNDTDSITIVLETGVQSRDGKKEKTMESERRA